MDWATISHSNRNMRTYLKPVYDKRYKGSVGNYFIWKDMNNALKKNDENAFFSALDNNIHKAEIDMFTNSRINGNIRNYSKKSKGRNTSAQGKNHSLVLEKIDEHKVPNNQIDQWTEIKDAEDVDLDDLKINRMTIREEETDTNSQTSTDTATREQLNPWQRVDDAVTEENLERAICDAIDDGSAKALKEAKSSVGAFSRSLAAGTDMPPSLLPRRNGSRKPVGAPNLRDAQNFPSLGDASVQATKPKNHKKKQTPQSNTQSTSSSRTPWAARSTAGAGQLYVPPWKKHAGNKFGILTDQSNY